MTNNPYMHHSAGHLKTIERDLIKLIRDPKTPGHRRLLAKADISKVREALRKKN